MAYTQLAREQRYQIKALLDTGVPRYKVAEAIGVHKSTISREINRNSGELF